METVTTNISAEIKSANQKFMKVFAQGDAAAIADLYTQDGMLLPPGMEGMQGKPAVRDFWQGAMNMGVKEVSLTTQEVQQCEDTAIELGNYNLTGEGGNTLDKGKYIVVWQKQNGEWKLQKDIWNTSLSAS